MLYSGNKQKTYSLVRLCYATSGEGDWLRNLTFRSFRPRAIFAAEPKKYLGSSFQGYVLGCLSNKHSKRRRNTAHFVPRFPHNTHTHTFFLHDSSLFWAFVWDEKHATR
mmetsp:Transcript_55101/g.66337  ORF Transcript_55101/g.66337 Transcript_55101/m.66337 type:complete len:109 (-) Transcript_55101:895-1221(-)